VVGTAPPVRRGRISARGLHWRIAAHVTGTILHLVPRRFRFRIALRTARLITPIVRRSMLYRHRMSLQDGPREETLRIVLRAMTRIGVPFDPEVEVDGAELVPDGPAIFVSGHFMLNILMSRWLHDRGETVTIVRWRPPAGLTVIGTTERLDALDTTPAVLVQARRRLAAGGKLIVDADGPDPAAGEALRLPQETVYVSDRIFRFAARIDVPVVFFATRFTARGPRLTLRRPSAPDASTMTREFRAFYLAMANDVTHL
jgi:hypothetical protein